MSFQIPNHDPDSLKMYSAAGLSDLRRLAYAEFQAIQASIKEVTAAAGSQNIADLDRAEALEAFIAAADEQLATFAAVDDRAAKLAEKDYAPAEVAAAVTEPEGEPEPVAAAVAAAATTTAPRLTAADIAPATIEGIPASVVAAASTAFTITAAAETGVAAGSVLPDFAAVTSAFIERTRTYGNATQVGRRDDALQHPVVKITRNFPENRMYRAGMNNEQIYEMGRDATSRQAFRDSVVAGVAWCAPSVIMLNTCSLITATGLWRGPEIGAPRGGIRHNQGIDFASIFGGGTGFNILTEAQVISDTTKTCVQVPCPSFVDDRLKVGALCITGDLLQNVGYPEFVQTFIEGAMAAQAHNVNRDIIALIVAGSTAVSLTTVDPWVSDNSVVSQVLSAAELAVVDIRYRLRLDPSETIEMVFPYWILAQMRADWIRRNAATPADLLDSMIMEMFATRGVIPQFVYDWQDAFSGLTTTGPGAATPLLALPSSPTVNLQFLAYPAGTWLLARQDVIRLDSVYDSTLLATNKVTQLFVEDGYLPMRMCTLSRVYTVNICPNGKTGLQRDVTCTDVTP
jgi:hypothetical protein